MVDRRDFLKFFGVGATVVPLIGGMPHSGAVARLVDIPHVEQVEPKIVMATAADVEALKYDTLRACVKIEQTKPNPAMFAFAGGEFVITATANEIDVTLMNLDGISCGGHWSTTKIPYSQMPIDCEFDIHVSYRRVPGTRWKDRTPYPWGRTGGVL